MAVLGLLLLAWGPCPGLWAQTVGAVAGPERELASTPCCCGCELENEQPAGAPPSDDRPLDEDCPFCSVYGGLGQALGASSVDAPAWTLPLVAVAIEQPVRRSAPVIGEARVDDPRGPPRPDGPLGPVVLLI